jgi:hypothetical protein
MTMQNVNIDMRVLSCLGGALYLMKIPARDYSFLNFINFLHDDNDICEMTLNQLVIFTNIIDICIYMKSKSTIACSELHIFWVAF